MHKIRRIQVMILCLRVEILPMMRYWHVIRIQGAAWGSGAHSGPINSANWSVSFFIHDVLMRLLILKELLVSIIQVLIIMVCLPNAHNRWPHLVSLINVFLLKLMVDSCSRWRLILMLVVILIWVLLTYSIRLRILHGRLLLTSDQKWLGAAWFCRAYSCRTLKPFLLLVCNHSVHLLWIFIYVS